MSDADDMDRRMEEFQRREMSGTVGNAEAEHAAAVSTNLEADQNSVYRAVNVGVHMREIMEQKKVKRKTGTRRETKKKGLLNKETYEVDVDVFEETLEWVGTGKYYDNLIDKKRFAEDIQRCCNRMADQGYELTLTSDVISGRFDYKTTSGTTSIANYGGLPSTLGWGYGYSYGYSVTDGIILLFKKITNAELSNAQQA